MSSTLSESVSATLTAVASATTSSTSSITLPPKLKVIGIILAITSGLLIGSSFVFKKKGLLKSQAGQVAGEGVAYLKSPLWWLGMAMMIVGELCNFAAYAFVEALVVTPLGALSVVVSAILSSIFLKETLTFFGWLGCFLCILGSVVIALNGPKEESIGQILEFQKLFLSVGFLVYTGILFAASASIVFYFGPKYGKKQMIWYILVCSMIGGISVSVTTGLGSAIVQTAYGDNQFKHWFMYFLFGFVIVTLITEVYYLNMALAMFNTAMVTPTYYVIFTFFSMVTTVILFQGLKATAAQIITIVMGFLVICTGITILQMSKVDPAQLTRLDRRSTILLQASRSNTQNFEEKGVTGFEDPGMDALRGSFGTMGSIIRARSARRMSQSSHLGPNNSFRTRPSGAGPGVPFPSSSAFDDPAGDGRWSSQQHFSASPAADELLPGMQRHQLYDAPVPRPPNSPSSLSSTQLPGTPKRGATIKFDSTDVVHQYHPTGTGDDSATHMQRHNLSGVAGLPYPPVPAVPLIPGPDEKRGSTDSGAASLRPPSSTRPSFAKSESSEPQGAPSTILAPYARPVPGRADSRRLFEQSTASNADTLLSFPSVTDSAMSGGFDSVIETRNSTARSGGLLFSDDDEDEDDERRGRAAQKKTSKYPKGSRDDDREESVSLWQRGGEDSGDDDARRGGIRLVKPSTPSRY